MVPFWIFAYLSQQLDKIYSWIEQNPYKHVTTSLQHPHRIPAGSSQSADNILATSLEILLEKLQMSGAIHGRYLQELQEQAKSTSPPDAARRLSLCELGSATPRPLRNLEGAGSNGVLNKNAYVLL